MQTTTINGFGFNATGFSLPLHSTNLMIVGVILPTSTGAVVDINITNQNGFEIDDYSFGEMVTKPSFYLPESCRDKFYQWCGCKDTAGFL